MGRFPVRDPVGHVVGALCVADYLPRRWSDGDIEVLEALAQIASREVALQIASQDGAERGELAQTLQEGLLPPRLPEIPGLQVAARYVAAVTGAEVLRTSSMCSRRCGGAGDGGWRRVRQGFRLPRVRQWPVPPATRSGCVKFAAEFWK